MTDRWTEPHATGSLYFYCLKESRFDCGDPMLSLSIPDTGRLAFVFNKSKIVFFCLTKIRNLI